MCVCIYIYIYIYRERERINKYIDIYGTALTHYPLCTEDVRPP